MSSVGACRSQGGPRRDGPPRRRLAAALGSLAGLAALWSPALPAQRGPAFAAGRALHRDAARSSLVPRRCHPDIKPRIQASQSELHQYVQASLEDQSGKGGQRAAARQRRLQRKAERFEQPDPLLCPKKFVEDQSSEGLANELEQFFADRPHGEVDVVAMSESEVLVLLKAVAALPLKRKVSCDMEPRRHDEMVTVRLFGGSELVFKKDPFVIYADRLLDAAQSRSHGYHTGNYISPYTKRLEELKEHMDRYEPGSVPIAGEEHFHDRDTIRADGASHGQITGAQHGANFEIHLDGPNEALDATSALYDYHKETFQSTRFTVRFADGEPSDRLVLRGSQSFEVKDAAGYSRRLHSNCHLSTSSALKDFVSTANNAMQVLSAHSTREVAVVSAGQDRAQTLQALSRMPMVLNVAAQVDARAWHGGTVVKFYKNVDILEEGSVMEMEVFPYDTIFGLYKKLKQELLAHTAVRLKLQHPVPTSAVVALRAIEYCQVHEGRRILFKAEPGIETMPEDLDLETMDVLAAFM